PLSAPQRREVVMALARDYPVRLVCRATGWPRSSLYAAAAPPAGEAELRQALTRLAGAWPTYGYRRLTAPLRRGGRPVDAKRVRGWALSRWLDQSLALGALDRALAGGAPAIHHSDQGVQYAATAYVERLAGRGVTISMAAAGVPEENGYAERLMRTIKEEEVE